MTITVLWASGGHTDGRVGGRVWGWGANLGPTGLGEPEGHCPSPPRSHPPSWLVWCVCLLCPAGFASLNLWPRGSLLPCPVQCPLAKTVGNGVSELSSHWHPRTQCSLYKDYIQAVGGQGYGSLLCLWLGGETCHLALGNPM